MVALMHTFASMSSFSTTQLECDSDTHTPSNPHKHTPPDSDRDRKRCGSQIGQIGSCRVEINGSSIYNAVMLLPLTWGELFHKNVHKRLSLCTKEKGSQNCLESATIVSTPFNCR